MIGMYSI